MQQVIHFLSQLIDVKLATTLFTVYIVPYLAKKLRNVVVTVDKKLDEDMAKEVEQNEDMNVIKQFFIKITKVVLKLIAITLFVPCWLLDKLLQGLDKVQEVIGQKEKKNDDPQQE